MTDPHLIEVRQAHRLDTTRLRSYLDGRVPGIGDRLRIRQFHGGQSNPTYLIECAGGAQLVLRKKPPGDLLPSAHMIEREYRILCALAASDVPVPPVHLLCEDTEVIGTAFYVMDFVRGRVLHPPSLPEFSPAERGEIYDAMNDTIARLHCVNWRAAGLEDFGRPQGYIERQIRRWRGQYDASRTREVVEMDNLADWLAAHLPDSAEDAIVHGDFRMQNLLFHPEHSRVVGVLDWELSTLGHPLTDLAYNCMVYHFPAADDAFPGVGGIALKGIPKEADYVAAYCRRTGRQSIDHWPFYMAFSLYRMAAILQGVYARALQGNASSENAIRMEPMVERLAQAGWRIANQD